MNFKQWFEVFRYDPTGNIKPELLEKITLIRKDPRFEEYGDDQIEMMLHHHTVDEILKYGPEVALERYNDFSILDAMTGDFGPLY
jgi:hypothetical protein